MSSVLAKSGCAVLVITAMVIMTRGLWATVYIEPTREAIAAEHRGYLLILVASAMLLAGAAIAQFILDAPSWSALAVAAPIVICTGATMTSAPAIISVVVAYPLALAGLLGALLFSR